MDGWIKLHRKIQQWEWYQDSNTFRLFIHCLINANFNGNKWQGEVLPRGSFPTSPEKLGVELCLSRQQIRTSINKLKSTSNITTKSTNKFTIISIVNYELYQDINSDSNHQNNQQINKPITNNQPTNNQQITTLEEIKNLRIKERKNKNKENYTVEQNFKNPNSETSQSEGSVFDVESKDFADSPSAEIVEENVYEKIIQYLNLLSGKVFRASSAVTKSHINARLSQGFTLQDFYRVIENKVACWKNDPKMNKFLRPETLFGNKFEGYLNEKVVNIYQKAVEPWVEFYQDKGVEHE